MRETKPLKGMILDNQVGLGINRNWKIVKNSSGKGRQHFCYTCGCPFREGKPNCYCET